MINKERLNYLLEKKKFADSEWEKRGLNPSDNELCELMESKFNECLHSLILLIENNAFQSKLKLELKRSLKSFDKSIFDTEEREFICDYFDEIAKIIETDFKNELNKWLYGSLLNSFIKLSSFIKGKEKVVDILSQECTKCHASLETFILQKEEGIPDSDFFIVRCKSCREFNLIDIGSNIKQLRFGEYELEEQLSRNQYDLDGAKIRLKQLQFFRK
ncbi:DUF4844 domain-containing protein [Flavobacterium sp. 17A]|uniref:DUF4844 domain-containing protein n=1 Tax=Flavobacterium potami TaxID=2872310 RepID=A0A9X1KRV0_9FLAO|nr:DUF4844 domain-containing protein [Flavobacterium potami]MBZ4036427.1 DUF4844 domain-containing protein [Flavobacterium potami]